VQGELLEQAILFAKKVIGKPLRRIRDEKAKLDGDPKAFFAHVRDRFLERDHREKSARVKRTE